MMTLRQFSAQPETIPASTSWYLADLSEARGKQELFTKQAPQRLKALREHALIESAVSSNRIEGVQVDQSRVHTLILGRAPVRDRKEEEVRGYCNALKLIHEKNAHLPVSEETILALHRFTRGEIWDAGKYKERYYETLEQSSQRCHEGRHDPWPYVNYLLFILKSCCREFEARLGQIKNPRGAKTEIIEAAVDAFSKSFALAELERACPGISRDMVRRVLRDLQKAGRVECLGRGSGARWQRRGNTHKRG
jgi:Fic family protein